MGISIVVRGVEKCDIPYYLTKMLVSNGHKVLFVDNSISKDMYNAVSGYLSGEDEDGISKGKLVFVKDINPTTSLEMMFDYIIYYYGFSSDLTYMGNFNYIISDYRAHIVEAVRERFYNIKDDCLYIIRDRVSDKIKDLTIAHTLDIDIDQIIGTIFFEESDYSNYINLTYNGIQSFDVSNEMKDAVKYMLMDCTELSEAEVVKTYIQKGKKSRLF